MKGATLMLGALALLLGCAGQARADFIVDQSFLWGPGESVGYDPYDRSPVGVIFVPTLSSVNHVQIVLYPFRGFAGQATMHVLIRQDTIQGPILGTSSETTIPAGRAYYITPPLPLTDFTFANAVSLTPGHPYVIQAVPDRAARSSRTLGLGTYGLQHLK